MGSPALKRRPHAAQRRISNSACRRTASSPLLAQFVCNSLLRVILATILADSGGHVADNEDGIAPLQGNCDRSGCRISFSAETHLMLAFSS